MASRVLTLDRNQRNLELLGQVLGKEGFETVALSNLSALDALLEQSDNFGLALVDISGFDRSIWNYCEKLSNKGVPLLVISPPQWKSVRQEGMAHGVQSVLFKPLVVKELVTMIYSMIRDETHE